jgi:hypothetical protein
MKKFTGLFALAALTALFASGCATVTHGPNQRVEITSAPEGAIVTANGLVIGTTPMTANLSRKHAHSVTVSRDGYAPETVVLMTVPNAPSQSFIRFGIDELVGAYSDLEPSTISARLDPLMLPTSVGSNPISDMASKVVEIDDMLANGEIKAAEHRYLLSRLIEFYQK